MLSHELYFSLHWAGQKRMGGVKIPRLGLLSRDQVKWKEEEERSHDGVGGLWAQNREGRTVRVGTTKAYLEAIDREANKIL